MNRVYLLTAPSLAVLSGVLIALAAGCTGSGEAAGSDELTRAECALYSGGDGEEPLLMAEEMPELIGGLPGLQRRIRYPDEAKQRGVEGRVYTQFTVNTNGVPVDIVVTRGLGAGLDLEAKRAISEARFKPARIDGCPVPVKMSLPITFHLRR